MPSKLTAYMEEHEWDTEAGYAVSEPMPAYSVTYKIGLLSKAELSKYYREFGWIVGASGDWNNRGWWLRSRFERAVPEISSYEALLRNTQADGIDYDTLGKLGCTGTVPGWSKAIRPCFYLNKDFFKNVKLDVASMGKSVKEALVNNYTYDEMENGAAGYTASELEEIGFTDKELYVTFKQFTDKASNPFSGLGSADSVRANVNIVNMREEAYPITLLLAMYNADNSLAAVSINTVSAVKGNNDYSVDMDIKDYRTGQYVKAFVWDMTGGNKPLIKTKNIAPEEKYDMNILFIGNSYTYYNDLPEIFKKLARSGGYNVYQDSLTSGGYSLLKHADSSGVVGNVSIQKITNPIKGWHSIAAAYLCLPAMRG